IAADGPAGTGNLTINALVSAIGRTAGTDMGGGAGGCISASADGDLRIGPAAVRLTVDGGGPDGDGGEVGLSSTRGVIDGQGTATASCAGPESSGGSVSLDAGGDATVEGSLLSTAGDGGGGEVSVSSSVGSVQIGKDSVIDVTAQSTGTGGSICLESGAGSG